jgi:hypothetical protein
MPSRAPSPFGSGFLSASLRRVYSLLCGEYFAVAPVIKVKGATNERVFLVADKPTSRWPQIFTALAIDSRRSVLLEGLLKSRLPDWSPAAAN